MAGGDERDDPGVFYAHHAAHVVAEALHDCVGGLCAGTVLERIRDHHSCADRIAGIEAAAAEALLRLRPAADPHRAFRGDFLHDPVREFHDYEPLLYTRTSGHSGFTS